MKELRKNFCTFIMSYGRADNVITLNLLKRFHYTGDWFIVCSTDDPTLEEYRKRYDKHVLVFDKADIAKRMDVADNLPGNKVIVYARNACFELAQSLGYEYFLELDDDYKTFQWRYKNTGALRGKDVMNYDHIFESMLEFLDASGALSVAFAQGGDLIGGLGGYKYQQKLVRKAMNTFFCTTKRPFKFIGKFNEDVNAYVLEAMRGGLFFTVMDAAITQLPTQSNKGGMTEAYLDKGTYVKSFYSVICAPSAVYLSEMGSSHKRIHHHVRWNNCAPKIISDRWKKKQA